MGMGANKKETQMDFTCPVCYTPKSSQDGHEQCSECKEFFAAIRTGNPDRLRARIRELKKQVRELKKTVSDLKRYAKQTEKLGSP